MVAKNVIDSLEHILFVKAKKIWKINVYGWITMVWGKLCIYNVGARCADGLQPGWEYSPGEAQ